MGTIFGWITGGVAKAVIGIFGDSIFKPFIDVWMKSKDVDLEKFKASTDSTEKLAGAMLIANVEFAKVKADYAVSVLQWWPFRIILFMLLFFPAAHLSMIVIDSSLIWFWKGTFGVFGVPPVPGKYFDIEAQLLLFFVIAKPVDSAVTGGMNALKAYIETKKR